MPTWRNKEKNYMQLHQDSHHLTVITIVIRIIIVISFVEFAVMLLFSTIQLQLDPISEAFLDAGLLSTFTAPFIYFWIILPFIKDRDKAEESIRYLALHDPLTGLANRRLLEEHLDHSINLCIRKRTHAALLLIDLDGFKPINDEYGHEAGDIILQDVAKCLKSVLRKVDIAARLGGDEFIVLINQISPDEDKAKESALNLAEKLRSRISHPVEFRGNSLSVGASIGLRIIKPKDKNIEALIREADSAMYSAKKAGRAQVIVFKP